MNYCECGVFVEVKRHCGRYVQDMRKDYRANRSSLTWGDLENVTHHIVPLSMGGDNSYDNLVRMDKKQHSELHKEFIDVQIEMFDIGDRGYIYIPCQYDLSLPKFRAYEVSFDKLMKMGIIENMIVRNNGR